MMLATFLGSYLGARRRFSSLTETSLREFQDSRARQQVQRAYTQGSYWRTHWQGCNLADWRSLPTTDKAAMMADFSHYNTVGVDKDQALKTALGAETSRDFRPTIPGTDITVGLSSGTTGHRGLFLASPNERAAWAGAILARALPGGLWSAPTNQGWRVSLFLRAASNLYDTVRGRFVKFYFHDLLEPIEQSVANLNKETPEVLLGPPSLLARLAVKRKAGRLRIQPLCVYSVAEVLEPQEAERLAEAFGLERIHQIYQATEGLLAVSCAAGGLHLQEDIVTVQTESLGDGRFVPILTDLWRTTQPILRYRLNDVLRLSETPCPCGSIFRTIEAIEGRQDDVCEFGGQSVYPDTLRRAILLASNEIVEYRLVQQRPNQLTLYLEPTPGADTKALEQEVCASLNRLLPQPELEIRFGLPTEEPVTRKRRRVQRCWE
ncbi:MAG: hypothetical protein QM758_17775 [Armatimonas sp.]